METTVDPVKLFGAARGIEAIAGGTPEENAALTLAVLKGERKDAYRDVAALNAAAAIVAGGLAETLEEGLKLAYASIDTGKALGKLNALVG